MMKFNVFLPIEYSMRGISLIFVLLVVALSSCTTTTTEEQLHLLNKVEGLNIKRGDYVLGKALTKKQKQIAKANPQKETTPGTYKFKDGDLYVVAESSTDRTIIIYEQIEPASKDKIREVIGSLMLDFGDPTVMAHEKIIYWAFSETGKLTEQEYLKAKKAKKNLMILATVKLNSTVKIMDDQKNLNSGSVYYIISSEPVLKLIKSK